MLCCFNFNSRNLHLRMKLNSFHILTQARAHLIKIILYPSTQLYYYIFICYRFYICTIALPRSLNCSPLCEVEATFVESFFSRFHCQHSSALQSNCTLYIAQRRYGGDTMSVTCETILQHSVFDH